MKIYSAATGAILRSINRSYSKSDGWTTELSYEGTEADITRLSAAMKSVGYEVNTSTSDGPVRSLTATLRNSGDGAEQWEETWEFPAQEIQQDILASDIALTLNEQTKMDLRAFFHDQTEPKNDGYLYHKNRRVAKLSGGAIVGWLADDTGSTEGASGNALILSWLWLMGTKSVWTSQLVVRITRTFSNNYGFTATISNINKLFTKSGLVSAESPPAAIKFTLPDSTTFDSNRFLWAYLKKTPDVQLGADGKWRTVTEYWYGYHSGDLYDDAV